jgi:ABC-type polysaccharide/polyol phosphate transport system ATPase subunit
METVSALRDVNLIVPGGKSLGIVGANGAGKTSLLRLIAGITEPTHGTVRVRGRVLPMLELGAGFHPDLTGYDNIFLQGILLGLPRARVRDIASSIIDFAEIEDFIHMPVTHYSSGMYLRLGFAISVHMDPDILLIDEAFSVGDLYFQEKCFEKIREFQRRGRTILLVTHDIGVVERLCDEVIWIDKGRIAAQGNPADIAHRYRAAMFEASFPRPAPMKHKEMLAGWARYGTGAVTFAYLDFLDENGGHRSVFENGKPMEIRLRYQVHGPLPETDCLILVQSYRGHGAVAIATHQMRRPVRLNPEGGELVFRIDRLDLAPGRYQLSALLFKGGSREVEKDFYDFHMRLYDFHVAPADGLSEIAGLDLPCRWEHYPRQ